MLYILDGNFSKMEEHLHKSRLIDQMEDCIKNLKTKYNKYLSGTGADLAAGTLWSVPYLLKHGDITKIYCVEYSKHRLTKIGPEVLGHYKVPPEKVILCLGSFYDLKLKNNSLDFIFLSQAFHHADNPELLLSEMSRVLKPDGTIIIIGEHVLNDKKEYLVNTAKYFIQIIPKKLQKRIFGRTFEGIKLSPTRADMVNIDPVLGDHLYLDKEYNEMFSRHNFKIESIKDNKSKFQSFILIPETNCNK